MKFYKYKKTDFYYIADLGYRFVLSTEPGRGYTEKKNVKSYVALARELEEIDSVPHEIQERFIKCVLNNGHLFQDIDETNAI